MPPNPVVDPNELAILVTEHWKCQAVGPLGDVAPGRILGIPRLSR